MSMTAAQRARLDASQRRLLRGVARLPRLEGEGPRRYMHRGNELIRESVEHDHEPWISWSALLERKKFLFAGHVVRHDELDCQEGLRYHSLLSEAVAWRSLQWQRAARVRGHEPLHGRGSPRRWEQHLFNWSLLRFNTQWTELARTLSVQQWRSLWDDFWTFLNSDDACRAMPSRELCNCRCGNVHFANVPCWPGFDGHTWCYVDRRDGSRGRFLATGPEQEYEIGMRVLRTDGAAPGQGGQEPIQSVGLGAALFVVGDGGVQPDRLFSVQVAGTNNIVAELHAIHAGLQQALLSDWPHMVVESDCKPVVGWIQGTMQIDAKHTYLRPLVTACRNLFFELLRRMRVQVRWIPRNVNRVADALSKLGARGYSVPWLSLPECMQSLPDMPWLCEVLPLCGVDVPG